MYSVRRPSFVHGAEIKPVIIVLDRLEVHPEDLLDAVWSQLVDRCNRSASLNAPGRTTLTGFAVSSRLIVASHAVLVESEICVNIWKVRTPWPTLVIGVFQVNPRCHLPTLHLLPPLPSPKLWWNTPLVSWAFL